MHVFQLLLKRMSRPFLCPSTGFFAIEYILSKPEFDGCDKHAFGFGFQEGRLGVLDDFLWILFMAIEH